MKQTNFLKFILLMIVCCGMTQFAWSQGTETFDNATDLPSGSDYGNGNFTGDNDVVWNYVHAQSVGTYNIDGNGILLRRANEPSSVKADLTGGIASFSVDTRKGYSGNAQRRLELVINGDVVDQFEPVFPAGETAEVVPFTVNDINIEGDFTLELRLYGSNGNQHIVLDNITWTGYSEQEPENLPVVTSETFNGTVGVSASFQIEATENPESYEIASGTLPEGLTLNETTGVISGIPTTAGNSSVTVTATNEFGTGDAATISFEIAVGTQTVTPDFSDISKYDDDAAFDLPLNTDQGIALIYTSSNLDVATISGNTVTIIGEGVTTIEATNTGNGNYNSFSDSFTLTVTERGDVYDGNGTFVRINSISDLTDGYYVIAANPEFGDWAMSNDHTGTFFTRAAVSPSSQTITDPAVGIVWKIESDGTGKVIYNESSAKYVSYTGSSNNVQVVDAVTTDNQRWNITFGSDEDEENVFLFNNAAVTARMLQYNSNQSQERFACYTTNQKKLVLYKLSDVTPAVPVVTSETFNGNLNVAASFQIQATESPTAYAVVSGTLPTGLTLNNTTGIISGTPTAAGNSTINVTATNAVGTSEEATINFVIAKGTQTMTPKLADLEKYVTDAPFTLPLSTDQGIEIIYTSDNPAVATVSGNTVTIVSVGQANISASNAGDNNYEAFSDSFVLSVGFLGVDNSDLNSLQIYTHNKNIVLDSKNEKILSVELFDIQGKSIHRNMKVNANSYQINSASKGVLIIRVQTQDGKIISKKLMN